MSAETYAAKARKHWTKWLPQMTADLKKADKFNAALQTAGKNAQRMVLELMEQGYQQTEAEEVALAQYVFLKPEQGAGLTDWETQELDELERQYRAQMAEPSDPDQPSLL